VSDLGKEGDIVPIVLKGAGHFKNKNDITVIMRRVPPPLHKKKTVFFVRHGESKWNKAENNKNLSQMLHFDHGLDENGIQAARELNQTWKKQLTSPDNDIMRDLMKRFIEAGTIYSSPLTRALSTALLVLQDHPSLASQELHLLSNAREVKNLGGLDTVGTRSGEDIISHVNEELAKILSPTDLHSVMLPMIDVYNCMGQWWNTTEESDIDIERRFQDVLATVKYSPHEAVIIVGHSLFFKKLFADHQTGGQLARNKPDLAQNMSTRKLNNCTLIMVEFDFAHLLEGGGRPDISDAHLLFGSFSQPKDKSHKLKHSGQVGHIKDKTGK